MYEKFFDTTSKNIIDKVYKNQKHWALLQFFCIGIIKNIFCIHKIIKIL